ncbi:O-antigen ligase family protein [Mucilaginibacter sp.]|uniref:O-antigen ligase family protein n=1 Tax=Mucilaginibacter sp. TaxID=1882438 RepID=UPI003D0C2107
MNALFSIKDNLANQISYYHLLLLMASLPFDRFYSHLILISLALHTLIQLNKKDLKYLFTWRTLVLQSVFYITVLSTIYTLNKAEAFNEWGERIAILIIPVIFCLNPLDLKKYRSPLLHSFALVCTVTVIYLYADALLTIRHYQLPYNALFSSAFTNHNFSEPIDMHATFFSMQLAISLIFLLSMLIKETRFYYRVFHLVCACILTAGIMQLSSKSIFITLVLIINMAIPYFLLQGKRRWILAGVTVSFSVLLIAAIFLSGTLHERYIIEFKSDLTKAQPGETLDPRLERWGIAVELIRKSPVIGYGAGSEVGLLQDSFFNKKLYSSYLHKLNSHNQYLSFLIKSGAIGLLIYITTLVFGFKISIQQRDLLFFTFMSIITLVSLSENILDVDKGVFFYAFFFSFFVFSNLPAKLVSIPVKSA